MLEDFIFKASWCHKFSVSFDLNTRFQRGLQDLGKGVGSEAGWSDEFRVRIFEWPRTAVPNQNRHHPANGQVELPGLVEWGWKSSISFFSYEFLILVIRMAPRRNEFLDFLHGWGCARKNGSVPSSTEYFLSSVCKCEIFSFFLSI